jgi:hypothetical protein
MWSRKLPVVPFRHASTIPLRLIMKAGHFNNLVHIFKESVVIMGHL